MTSEIIHSVTKDKLSQYSSAVGWLEHSNKNITVIVERVGRKQRKTIIKLVDNEVSEIADIGDSFNKVRLLLITLVMHSRKNTVQRSCIYYCRIKQAQTHRLRCDCGVVDSDNYSGLQIIQTIYFWDFRIRHLQFPVLRMTTLFGASMSYRTIYNRLHSVSIPMTFYIRQFIELINQSINKN